MFLNKKFFLQLYILLTALIFSNNSWAQFTQGKYPISTINEMGIPMVGVEDFNGSVIPVTGELMYPTPHILGNLYLQGLRTNRHLNHYNTHANYSLLFASSFDEDHEDQSVHQDILNNYDVSYNDLNGEHILGIAEGTSAMIPFFNNIHKEVPTISNPIKAVGIDLTYGNSVLPQGATGVAAIKEFRKTYASTAIYDRAEELNKFKDSKYKNKFKLIYGHMIFQYLDAKDRKKLIRRCLDLLKPNGTIRFNMAGTHNPIYEDDSDDGILDGDEIREDYNFKYIMIQKKGDFGLKSRQNLNYTPSSFKEWRENTFDLPLSILSPSDPISMIDIWKMMRFESFDNEPTMVESTTAEESIDNVINNANKMLYVAPHDSEQYILIIKKLN